MSNDGQIPWGAWVETLRKAEREHHRRQVEEIIKAQKPLADLFKKERARGEQGEGL